MQVVHMQTGISSFGAAFNERTTQKCVENKFSNNARHITDGFIQAVAVSDQLYTTSQRIVS